MSISSPSTSHFEIGCTSACPSFFSFGGIVIDKKLIKQDIRSLFLLYISLNTTSLETFRDLWYERGFSLIHYICTQRDSKDLFLEYIYSVILSYFLVSPTSCGRAGVVYALYLLRESEPLKGSISQTHIPIPIINTVMYNELKESYQVFSTEGLIEPLLVLRYLFKNDAFGYIQNRSTLFDIEDSGSDLSQNLLSPTTLDDPRYFDDNLLVGKA